MDWMETLMHQHENISKLLDVMHEKTIDILNTKDIQKDWFAQCLYFIGEYADKEHHELEEGTVFQLLVDVNEQGRILVEHGMLVEHQLARYYVKQMKKLLNEQVDDTLCVQFIGFAQSYIDLLRRHIDKENGVAFPYAKKMIDETILQTEFDSIKQTSVEKELLAFLNL